MKLKTIKVYGRLRKFLGSSYFEAAVSSPAEAIRFLMCNFPAVEQHMTQQYYKIKMNNNDVPLDYLSMSGKGDIQIIPVATGSLPAVAAIVGGIASTATAVAGTVLTTAATVGSAVVAGVSAVGSAIGTVAAGIAAEYGTTGILGTLTTMAVNTLAIEGVTALLAPTPQPFDNGSGGSSEPDGSLDPQAANSYSFSGIQNVSVSGVSVPIIYGEVFTGSVVISAGVDTVQVEGTA